MSDFDEIIPLPPNILRGKHIRPFRKKYDFTQDMLAQVLKVSRQTINTREKTANNNSILPENEQILLWALMTKYGHDPWHETSPLKNKEGNDHMTKEENKHSYKDYTENMGDFQQAYQDLSKYFDTLVEHVENKIDRVCLVNVSNPKRDAQSIIIAASTSMNAGREVDDKLLLSGVQEVLLKESDENEKDNEASCDLDDGLYLSARLDDNAKFKLIFFSADSFPMVFEGAIQANYIDIGRKFRKALDELRIKLR